MKSQRRFILVGLILIFMNLICQSQELTIDNVEMSPFDLTARLSPRADFNGDNCAVVKVQIPLENVTFEGDYFGEIEHTGGEYILYMIKGAKKFKIKHNQLKVCEVIFANWGIPDLVSEVTYVVEASIPKELWSANLHGGAQQQKQAFKDRDNVYSFTINGVWFDFVLIEGDSFIMGGTSEQGNDAYDVEKPAHRVLLDEYMIGQTEVTQGMWKAIMGEYPKYYLGDDNFPVVGVSWQECNQFISRLNEMTGGVYRLPTEAEWEYAARGGNISHGFKYSGSNNVNNVACYVDNSFSDIPNLVKSKAPNELGIYDMSGNVAEWCSDWFEEYSSDYQVNPIGPSSGEWKIIRGGAFSSIARLCRVSDRDYRPSDYAPNYSGFRLCFTPKK